MLTTKRTPITHRQRHKCNAQHINCADNNNNINNKKKHLNEITNCIHCTYPSRWPPQNRTLYSYHFSLEHNRKKNHNRLKIKCLFLFELIFIRSSRSSDWHQNAQFINNSSHFFYLLLLSFGRMMMIIIIVSHRVAPQLSLALSPKQWLNKLLN